MSIATKPNNLPVVVLGAGPVGLAAAAHLVERGITPLVLEAGPAVAANLATYRQVRLFSPWQFNVDKAARRLLLQHGWLAPADDGLPTAGELVAQYLAPLAKLPEIAPRLRFNQRVVAITRAGADKVKTKGREGAPFVVRTQAPDGLQEFLASAVIDATGTWSQPNPLGANGIPALGETALGDRIAYGMPDVAGAERQQYAGQRVLVVGAGHSAAGTLLALAQLAEQAPGTSIVWLTRSSQLARVYGGGDADGLRARGQLGQRLKALRDSGSLEMHQGFRIRQVVEAGGRLQVIGEAADGAATAIDGIDRIVCATGARPDLSITRELRVRHDPWLESTDLLAPLIDPNEHSCGSVRPHGHRELAHPEAGYYAVGAKSYGRAPNFLMATGYEQVRSVVAALAGDMKAADDVQLELPETGVCNTRLAYDDQAPGASSGCCGSDKSDDDTGSGQSGRNCGNQAGCGTSRPSPACCASAGAAAPSGAASAGKGILARWLRAMALSGASCCA